MNEKQKKVWLLSEQEEGIKLKNFLVDKLNGTLSAKAVKRILDAGLCYVNGKVEKIGSHVLAFQDLIEAYLETDSLLLCPFKGNFNSDCILYEDEYLLAYDKPPGMICDPQKLTFFFTSSKRNLILVHRLDKDTSGVLLFAKKTDVFYAMVRLFQEKKIIKHYLAIVDGLFSHKKGKIANYLGKIRTLAGQAVWGEIASSKGYYAETLWCVLKEGRHTSLVQLMPLTGRTHQLRTHMASIGHPILGDVQYAKSFAADFQIYRHMLHAEKVRFIHPIQNRELEISSLLPSDFLEVSSRLFNKES